jgi:hypothetical protein
VKPPRQRIWVPSAPTAFCATGRARILLRCWIPVCHWGNALPSAVSPLGKRTSSVDQKTGRALGDGKGGVWGFGFDSAGVRAQRRMRRLAEADLFEPPMWRMRLVAHWSAAHTVGRGIDERSSISRPIPVDDFTSESDGLRLVATIREAWGPPIRFRNDLAPDQIATVSVPRQGAEEPETCSRIMTTGERRR